MPNICFFEGYDVCQKVILVCFQNSGRGGPTRSHDLLNEQMNVIIAVYCFYRIFTTKRYMASLKVQTVEVGITDIIKLFNQFQTQGLSRDTDGIA